MPVSEEIFNKEVDEVVKKPKRKLTDKQKENLRLGKNEKIQTRETLFHTLKVKCLEKASSVKEYNEIKGALDGIDEDTLHDDDKLKDYAKKVMKPYISIVEVKEI